MLWQLADVHKSILAKDVLIFGHAFRNFSFWQLQPKKLCKSICDAYNRTCKILYRAYSIVPFSSEKCPNSLASSIKYSIVPLPLKNNLKNSLAGKVTEELKDRRQHSEGHHNNLIQLFFFIKLLQFSSFINILQIITHNVIQESYKTTSS